MSDNFDQREGIHKKIHRLLEAFVYDYLRKSGAHEAAKNYYKEARLYDWPPPWLSSERIFPTTFTNAQESNQAYQTYTTITNANTPQVVDAGSSQTYISPPIFTPDQVSEWNVENQEGNSISGITANDNTKLDYQQMLEFMRICALMKNNENNQCSNQEMKAKPAIHNNIDSFCNNATDSVFYALSDEHDERDYNINQESHVDNIIHFACHPYSELIRDHFTPKSYTPPINQENNSIHDIKKKEWQPYDTQDNPIFTIERVSSMKPLSTSIDPPELPLPLDVPEGFLHEWWIVFWEMFGEEYERQTGIS
ncbi:5593_t:CDS:2, partial [Gigaspora rosea]